MMISLGQINSRENLAAMRLRFMHTLMIVREAKPLGSKRKPQSNHFDTTKIGKR